MITAEHRLLLLCQARLVTQAIRAEVGPDAEGMMAARNRLAAEDWVRMGDELSDQEYNARFKEYFGIDL